MEQFTFNIPTLPIKDIEPIEPINLTEVFLANKTCKDCGDVNPCTNCGEKVLLI